jgi:hypothetical protein
LFKNTEGNLTRIKLETRIELDRIEEEARSMETAEGSQGELISTSAANKMGEGSATCVEIGELEEIEEANEKRATCTESAELEEAAEGEIEEKMQTGQFFDLCCRGFLKDLSNLFFRTYHHDDTSEYSLCLP